MPSHLCISFRFIQPHSLFHGRADGDEPEWPPSPMRAFQALLNAACLRTSGKPLPLEVRSAFQTLEVLRPSIVAPHATLSTTGHRAYVPHNQADLVTAAWHRGNLTASISLHRMEKDFRPHRINAVGEELPAVHYLYSLDSITSDPNELLSAIRPSVRSIYSLGWGIDQVVADATLIDSALSLTAGEKWTPTLRGGSRLRAPRHGSLDSLMLRHDKFLNRLIDGDWTPVPPLSAIDQVRYRRDTDPVGLPHAVFKLVDEDDDTYRYPHAKLVHIAGMVRHLAIEAMRKDPPRGIENPADWVSRVVRGKRDDSSGKEHAQFSYIPLPSIGHAHADAMIRNVMVVAPLGMERELSHLAERLDGQPLQPEGEWEACESELKPHVPKRIELRKFSPPVGKFIDSYYLGTSRDWHSVTPVILDGHNDKKDEKTIKLIQTALQRAGIETPCEFAWQAVPFLKNCLSAHKYDRSGQQIGYHRPAHLKHLTALHVRLTFEHPIPGPLAIGAGRHCGFGLMAAVRAPTELV